VLWPLTVHGADGASQQEYQQTLLDEKLASPNKRFDRLERLYIRQAERAGMVGVQGSLTTSEYIDQLQGQFTDVEVVIPANRVSKRRAEKISKKPRLPILPITTTYGPEKISLVAHAYGLWMCHSEKYRAFMATLRKEYDTSDLYLP
jgi:hypothetical protein